MGDQQRTPEQEKVYQQGRADAFAEASKKKTEAAKADQPKHLRPDYTGPLTGDEAQDIHRLREKAEKAKAASANETKPASVQATK
jgi:hypothetical protein